MSGIKNKDKVTFKQYLKPKKKKDPVRFKSRLEPKTKIQEDLNHAF